MKTIKNTPKFCFVCGSRLKEFGLGILNCSDEKCNSIYLPFIDENGNQNLMLGQDKENVVSYDLPKGK